MPRARNMEHRYHRRYPMDAEVLLYRQGLPVAFARLRNLSLEGALVEVEPDKTFRRHVPFQLEVRLPGQKGPCPRLRGYVVHVSGERVGFMLETDDAATRRQAAAILERAGESGHGVPVEG